MRSLQSLNKYFEILYKQNKTINLVSRKIDKVEFQKQTTKEAKWIAQNVQSIGGHLQGVDIGSGGGLPVILLAILLPDVQFCAIEANQKKAKFLLQTTKALDLQNLKIEDRRVEAIKSFLKYDFGTAKAVAHTAVLLEYFSPLIKTGGLIFLPKGPSVKTETDEARKAAEILGFKLIKIEVNDQEGAMAVYKKAKKASIDVPRRIGEAKNRPLV